jgi:hypothetical protein
MILNKNNIVFDLKIKLNSGKYLSLKDDIQDFDAALKEAKSFMSDKRDGVYSIQIWETKNKITTSMIHEEI